MKLTRLQKRLIATGIGLLFIIYGVIQGILKIEIKNPLVDTVFFILFVIAAAFLFSNKKEEDGAERKERDQT